MEIIKKTAVYSERFKKKRMDYGSFRSVLNAPTTTDSYGFIITINVCKLK